MASPKEQVKESQTEKKDVVRGRELKSVLFGSGVTVGHVVLSSINTEKKQPDMKLFLNPQETIVNVLHGKDFSIERGIPLGIAKEWDYK